eukprot:scaffold3277_cov202-Skeletonema_marinoi.AAC.3
MIFGRPSYKLRNKGCQDANNFLLCRRGVTMCWCLNETVRCRSSRRQEQQEKKMKESSYELYADDM